MTIDDILLHIGDVSTPPPPHHRTEIGRRLRATRVALGMTPRRLCEACGIGESTYSQWEAGLRFPEVLRVIPLVQRFRLTLDWFYLGDISGVPYDLARKIQEELANDTGPSEPTQS